MHNTSNTHFGDRQKHYYATSICAKNVTNATLSDEESLAFNDTMSVSSALNERTTSTCEEETSL